MYRTVYTCTCTLYIIITFVQCKNVQMYMYMYAADLCPLLLVAHGSTGVDGRTQTRSGHGLELRLVAMVGTSWRGQPADTGHE